MFTIHECRPEEYAAVAAICNRIDPRPISGEELQRRDIELRQEPDIRIVRLVAADGAGRIAGYCVGSYNSASREGVWFGRVLVDPDWRREGAGTALADALEGYCREQGARQLRSETASGADDALAWAVHRGYAVERERTESVLDLAGWDGARFAPALERVRAGGLTLTTMQELPEAMLPEVYETDVATSHDHPEYDGRDSTYDEWLRRKRLDTNPCFYAFALEGKRVAGYSEIYLPEAPGGEAYTEYTCVRREYRGRGVALAVKLLTIEAAIAAGASRMRTNNNPENLPMLKVNEKLGYQMLPAPRVLVKTLQT